MAAILAIKKTIVIEDNTGNRWNLILNGDFRVIVDTAATFEDNEIKDLCSIRVMKGELTVARFLVYENADTKRGYLLNVPGFELDGNAHMIVLMPANANLATPVTEIDYHSGAHRIEIR
jgi:hypothetical protein